MGKEENEGNIVRIAERDFRIYLGVCDLLFQKYDQVILCAKEKYLEKLISIQNIKRAVGIELDKKYKNPLTGKPKFESEEVETTNDFTGRREIIKVYKLGLTKIPELFMYTDPDKAIEFPPLEEKD
jgi:hypothetical protein